MPFRSDLDAAYARSEALEQRIAELEAENERLRAGDTVEPEEDAAARRKRVTLAAVIVAVVGGALTAAGYFVDPEHVAAIIAGALTVGALCLLVALESLSEVCPPGYVLVVSGRQRRMADGRVVGHRLITGGRIVRWPLIERVQLLDARMREVEIDASNVYIEGNQRVDLHLRAQVGLHRHEPHVEKAIERFLGRPRDESDRVAADIIESKARELLAELPLAVLEQDRAKLVQALTDESEDELDRIGMALVRLDVIDLTVAS